MNGKGVVAKRRITTISYFHHRRKRTPVSSGVIKFTFAGHFCDSEGGNARSPFSAEGERASERSAVAGAAVPAARSVAEASGLERCRAGSRRMGGPNGRAPMRRARRRTHGRRAMAGLGAGTKCRAVMPRRKRAGVVMVVAWRRHPERREHGNDEGGGVIAASHGYASGIDASGGDCDRTAYGRAAVVVCAAGEGGAEQCGAEKRGEALHGRTPCVWEEGRRELPAFLH